MQQVALLRRHSSLPIIFTVRSRDHGVLVCVCVCVCVYVCVCVRVYMAVYVSCLLYTSDAADD